MDRIFIGEDIEKRQYIHRVQKSAWDYYRICKTVSFWDDRESDRVNRVVMDRVHIICSLVKLNRVKKKLYKSLVGLVGIENMHLMMDSVGIRYFIENRVG